MPIESKWVSRGWRREAQTLRNVYEQGVIATKDVTDVANSVWAVPARVLALVMR